MQHNRHPAKRQPAGQKQLWHVNPTKSPIATAQTRACKGDPATLHASMEKAKFKMFELARSLSAKPMLRTQQKRPHNSAHGGGGVA
jgi:hypothetical protein